MATGVNPGTVAALHPRPGAAEEALRMVADGSSWADASRRLVDSFSVDDLNAAWLWWVRRMPANRWDDFRAGAVLRVLEAALAEAEPLT